MEYSPKISVIMPVFNAEKYVKFAIDSILQQTYEDFELILIDDHGTDNSMEIARKIQDTRIRIIDNGENRGIAFARNHGMQCARGEYIALMDDDDIAVNHRFQTEVEFLDSHKEIDVVAGGELWIDDKGKVISYIEQIICNPKRIKAELLFQDVIENGSAMFRSDFVRKNNIVYKDDFMGMEDYKFWTECSAHGLLANLSEILLYWRKTEQSETARVNRAHREKRRIKFAQIQTELLELYGFKLTHSELDVFTRHFAEDKRCTITREDLKQLLAVVKKLIAQAKEKNIDYFKEFELVCRRRFAQKVEYSDIWE